MNPSPAKSRPAVEVAGVFFKLGLTAFGGPAAHVALMREEVVKRRRWIDDQGFLDLLGAANLIPGPNSTEMAIHLGFVRAGLPGLILGGACFILPAMLLVIALSWLYVRYGATPAASAILYGIKPVIIAVILQALISLGQKAIKGPLTALVGVVVLGFSLLGWNELALLLGGALVVMVGANLRHIRPRAPGAMSALLFAQAVPAHLPIQILNLFTLAPWRELGAVVPFDPATLFLTFLKIGSILYGSGYVLLAYLRADFVTRLGWITDAQLVDAIAIGQVTPGPVFTTATFVGYILGGLPGSALATLGIFLPGFVFVALSNPFIPRLRHSPWASGLLDGVNVASLGLMAAVTGQLAIGSLVDVFTIFLALASFVLLFRFRVNSTWLVAGSAILGLLRAASL